MRRYALALLILLAIGFVLGAGTDGAAALVVAFAFSGICIAVIRWMDFEVDFLIDVFLVALVARLAFGLFIHVYELREFFGGDAFTYDMFGMQIVDVWTGQASPQDPLSFRAMSTLTPGWGINYLVGALYFIAGPNMLAAQTFMAVFGAATAPLVYYCAFQVFKNHRVSRMSALLVALFPAFVVWSGQLLKDGIIIFALALAMTMVLRLQAKYDTKAVIVLLVSLLAIISFRFYIFYMIAVAVAGSFIIGRQSSMKNVIRGLILLVALGVALTYVGVLQTATENFGRYGSLEMLSRSRADLAKSAESGFAEEIDVSTAEGALSTMPIGLTYLMLAPFPWSAGSVRQLITLPEVLVWWAMLPLLLTGVIYTLRHRLREAMPILLFSIMLTLAYSIFQGNVGTAYRQRTQVQVFFFIFIAVGWGLIKERRENALAVRQEADRRRETHLRERWARAEGQG